MSFKIQMQFKLPSTSVFSCPQINGVETYVVNIAMLKSG